jgi:hypothetical protein
MKGQYIFAAMVLLASVFVLGYKYIARKNMFKYRKPMNIEEIYSNHVKKHNVNYEVFLKVYELLGSAYKIDMRLIRPLDKMKLLYEVDSWDLDHGTEIVNNWLEKSLNIKKPVKNISTVMDLLMYVQNSK